MARGRLGTRIAAVSPAGYLRWQTTRAGLETVLARLRQMRLLDERRPTHVAAARPGLFELRHRFQVALEVGDAPAARVALAAIDADQLDSAVNTGFMRLRLHAAFLDDAALVADPDLPLLLQMRLPSRVRTAVFEAYHRLMLQSLEMVGDLKGAIERYRYDLDDLMGTQIATLSPSDTKAHVVSARLAGYRQFLRDEIESLKSITAQHPNDTILHGLLAACATPASPEPGEQPQAASEEPVAPRPPHGPAMPTLPSSSLDRPLDVVSLTSAIDTPDSRAWASLPDAFRQGRCDAIDAFLAFLSTDATDHGLPAALLPATLADALFEIATLPNASWDGQLADQFDRLVLSVIDATQPALSRPEYLSVYGALLSIWSERRCNSAYPPDGHLLLMLVDAVLTHGGATQEFEAVSSIRSWWNTRPVRARLPWLLEALDILTEKGAAPGSASHNTASSLWLDGVDLIRRDPGSTSQGEVALWRRIGGRLGFDNEAVTDYLGPLVPANSASPDPLRGVPLRRVAIVTLQERAAVAAREILAERTDAEFIIVCEYVAGPATAAAHAADVILFAWAANKHSVYRAFDDVRERLVYVAGKGASSIVRALERWAHRSSNG
jgi:hypothetical protein